jgi:hypothetical protein
MKGERQLLRAGELLVGHAARWLPARIRDERYREWAAELPAILRDPSLGPGWRRAARMLGYALDTIRGAAAPGSGQAHYQGAHRGRDRWTMVKTARWLLFLTTMLAVTLAFLALPVLLIYLVSWNTGVGLWASTGISFMIIVACGLLPRRAQAVSALLWAVWQIYLLSTTPSWWPAGSPASLRIIDCMVGAITWYWVFEIGRDRLRRRRHLGKN